MYIYIDDAYTRVYIYTYIDTYIYICESKDIFLLGPPVFDMVSKGARSTRPLTRIRIGAKLHRLADKSMICANGS